MKNTILKTMLKVFICIVSVGLYSCNNNNSNNDAEDTILESMDEVIVDETGVFAEGQKIYISKCQACHMKKGEGVEESFPPLSGSDFLNDRNAVINIVANGHSDTIEVNGMEYIGTMPKFDFSDEDVAEVINYIFNSWGNQYGSITAEEVTDVKSK